MSSRFGESDFNNVNGKPIEGVVKEYSPIMGYGFILCLDGKDIFLSSYDIGRYRETKIGIGTIIRFVPVLRNDKYVASEIEIVDNSMQDDYIQVSDDFSILIRRIAKIMYKNGEQVIKENGLRIEDLQDNGISVDELAHISISVKKRNCPDYKIFDKSSRFKGCAQVSNLNSFYHDLKNRLLWRKAV